MIEFSPLTWFYVLSALTGILVAEAAFLLIARHGDKRADINRRVRLGAKHGSQAHVLVQLRKERGLDGASGGGVLHKLSVLRTQSGMRMPLGRLFLICTAIGLGLGAFAALRLSLLYLAPIGAIVGGLALPRFVLSHLKKRRLKLFGIQLPEALDLIVRGLKAGHPVPVALAMVGREMPDPIGTEFGIVGDEVTYGSDLVSALKGMNVRVGHEDLPLFVTAVSIQSSTGGNLREILDGLSGTIRSRVKLRRKIRSISTEGRMSAYILTAVPALLACAVFVIKPDYYSEVMDQNLTYILIGAALGLLAIGNLAMFRMANFKF